MKKIYLLYLFIFIFSFYACKQNKSPEAKRVILIGIDGVSINGFERAKTPNINKLIKNGAVSLKTRAVIPTVSGPNWASILLGAGPEQHGVTINGWTTTYRTIEPTVQDSDGYFPSIFDLIKEQKPDLKTAAFYDWKALGYLYNHKSVDKDEYVPDYKNVFKKGIDWIKDNPEGFTFLYAGLPDEKGHAYQWESPEYIQAINDVDTQIGILIEALKNADLYEDTYFLVVTDHGGIGFGHGGMTMREIEVPWIISGKKIIKGKVIEQTNDLVNTATTIAYLFGLKTPEAWTGKVQKSVFINEETSKINKNTYVNRPYTNIQSGIYQSAKKVVLENNDGSPIYYQTNGKIPNEQSAKYTKPLFVKKSVDLIAVSIKNGALSMPLKLKLDICYPVQSVELVYNPSEQYQGKGAKSLFDTQTASQNFKDERWLGFHEKDMIVTADLGELKTIHTVQINCLKNNYSYIFMPQNIEIFVSKNGIEYQKTAVLTKTEIDKNSHDGINRISLKFKAIKGRYVKIAAKNIGKCPPEHYAAGAPAWLFVDEILIN